MAYVIRWAVQEYINGRWVVVRSFTSRRAAEEWRDENGSPEMRVKKISVRA